MQEELELLEYYEEKHIKNVKAARSGDGRKIAIFSISHQNEVSVKFSDYLGETYHIFCSIEDVKKFIRRKRLVCAEMIEKRWRKEETYSIYYWEYNR